jgi:hypothetical protein
MTHMCVIILSWYQKNYCFCLTLFPNGTANNWKYWGNWIIYWGPIWKKRRSWQSMATRNWCTEAEHLCWTLSTNILYKCYISCTWKELLTWVCWLTFLYWEYSHNMHNVYLKICILKMVNIETRIVKKSFNLIFVLSIRNLVSIAAPVVTHLAIMPDNYIDNHLFWVAE